MPTRASPRVSPAARANSRAYEDSRSVAGGGGARDGPARGERFAGGGGVRPAIDGSASIRGRSVGFARRAGSRVTRTASRAASAEVSRRHFLKSHRSNRLRSENSDSKPPGRATASGPRRLGVATPRASAAAAAALFRRGALGGDARARRAAVRAMVALAVSAVARRRRASRRRAKRSSGEGALARVGGADARRAC